MCSPNTPNTLEENSAELIFFFGFGIFSILEDFSCASQLGVWTIFKWTFEEWTYESTSQATNIIFWNCLEASIYWCSLYVVGRTWEKLKLV